VCDSLQFRIGLQSHNKRNHTCEHLLSCMQPADKKRHFLLWVIGHPEQGTPIRALCSMIRSSCRDAEKEVWSGRGMTSRRAKFFDSGFLYRPIWLRFFPIHALYLPLYLSRQFKSSLVCMMQYEYKRAGQRRHLTSNEPTKHIAHPNKPTRRTEPCALRAPRCQ
jgi:hypothetical protein